MLFHLNFFSEMFGDGLNIMHKIMFIGCLQVNNSSILPNSRQNEVQVKWSMGVNNHESSRYIKISTTDNQGTPRTMALSPNAFLLVH